MVFLFIKKDGGEEKREKEGKKRERKIAKIY